MASGVPIVGVDAPGVRDVVRDKLNGRLLQHENAEDFAAALEWLERQNTAERKRLSENSRKTADTFSMEKCVSLALGIYEELVQMKDFVRKPSEDSAWSQAMRLIQADWEVLKNITSAATGALLKPEDPSASPPD
jgi:1,2-diacylglycerol 3-alpha-glucosyltransferase